MDAAEEGRAEMDWREGLRVWVGVWAPEGKRNIKDEGGGAAVVLNAALLLSRGAIVGAFVEGTLTDPRLLCPGTPSKVLVLGDGVLSDLTGRALTGVTGV